MAKVMRKCFPTVMLEKTLESPLDYKEIQPAHSVEAEKSRIKVPADQAASEGPLSSLLAMTAFYWVFTPGRER